MRIDLEMTVCVYWVKERERESYRWYTETELADKMMEERKLKANVAVYYYCHVRF